MRVTGISEFLLLFLFLVGFILFNVIQGRMSRRRRQERLEREIETLEQEPARLPEKPQQRAPAGVPAQRPAPVTAKPSTSPLDTGWGRAPEPIAPEPVTPLVLAPPPERVMPRELRALQPHVPPAAPRHAKEKRRHAHAAWLGSRQGMRQAVIAMAVLGPCRALHPYDASEKS